MATPSPSPAPILIDLLNNDSGFLFTGRSDRLKARRDNAIRWHDDVRTFVADAVTSARAIHQESADRERFVDVADPDRQDGADHPYALSVKRAKREHGNLLELHGGLSLVAPRTITDALVEVIKASTQLSLARDDKADEYRKKLRQAMAVLVDATREHLGTEEETKK